MSKYRKQKYAIIKIIIKDALLFSVTIFV